MIILISKYLQINIFKNSSFRIPNDYLVGFRFFKSAWEENKKRKRKTTVVGFLFCKLVITINYFYLNDIDCSLINKHEYNRGLETAESIVQESCCSEEDKQVLLAAIEGSKKP